MQIQSKKVPWFNGKDVVFLPKGTRYRGKDWKRIKIKYEVDEEIITGGVVQHIKYDEPKDNYILNKALQLVLSIIDLAKTPQQNWHTIRTAVSKFDVNVGFKPAKDLVTLVNKGHFVEFDLGTEIPKCNWGIV